METLEAVKMIEHLKQGLGKQGQVSLSRSLSYTLISVTCASEVEKHTFPSLSFFAGCTYRTDRSKGGSLCGNPRKYFEGSERSP